MSTKLATITYLVSPDYVCLAPKLAGFGSPYLNGYGGKVKTELGESPATAAIREVGEEGEVGVAPANLVAITTMDFFRGDQHLFKCHIFLATHWTGKATATKEMGRPVFYQRDAPPLDKMWSGDALWLPRILKGKVLPHGGFTRYDHSMKKVTEFFLPPMTWTGINMNTGLQ